MTAKRIGIIAQRTVNVCAFVVFSTTLMLAYGGCASSHKQKVVAAYQISATAIGTFQDAEIALYNAKTLPSLTEAKHVEVHKLLSRVTDIQVKVGDALLIWQSGQPAPASVAAWMDEGVRTIAEIRKMFPDNDRLRLIEMIVPWVKAIVETVQLLGLKPPAELVSVAVEGKV
jgi:hypothetical protein